MDDEDDDNYEDDDYSGEEDFEQISGDEVELGTAGESRGNTNVNKTALTEKNRE